MSNFAELLSKSFDEIEKPKPLPRGTYMCQIEKLPLQEMKGKDKSTPALTFMFRPISAESDVDPDQLAAWGTLGNTNFRIRGQFFLTESAFFRLKDFLEAVLSAEECHGKGFDELVGETPSKFIKVRVDHEVSPSGKDIYLRVVDYARAE